MYRSYIGPWSIFEKVGTYEKISEEKVCYKHFFWNQV